MDCHVFRVKEVAEQVFICFTTDLLLAGVAVTHTCMTNERLRFRNGGWEWERSTDDWIDVSTAPFSWVATFTATDQIDENFAIAEVFAVGGITQDTDWKQITDSADQVVEQILRKLQTDNIPNSKDICFDVFELLGQPVESPTWTYIERIITETPGVDNFTREFDGETLTISISTGGQTRKIELVVGAA